MNKLYLDYTSVKIYLEIDRCRRRVTNDARRAGL